MTTQRVRRGKVVEIPEEWQGKTLHKQTRQKRQSKLTRVTAKQRVLVDAGWLATLVEDHNRGAEDLQTAYAALRAIGLLTRPRSVIGKMARRTTAQLEHRAEGTLTPELKAELTPAECRRLLREGLPSETYLELAREVDEEMGEEWT